MIKLHSLYDRFQEVILKGRISDFDHEIKPNPRISAREQLGIYIDGYRVRMSHAIKVDYPGLATYLGEKLFSEYALDYIEEHPSHSYNLHHYGHGFAQWLAQRSKDSFALELAQLEHAITDAFMAEESEAFTPQALADIDPEVFGAMALKPRKSLRLLAFHHPVNSWLEKQRGGAATTMVKPQNSFVAVVRHRNVVKRIVMEEAPYLLLSEMAKGQTVGWAIDEVLMARPESIQQVSSHLRNWFTEWVENGFFTN